MRIEDDVLVTAEGNEVLNAAAPKTVADIEALMREGDDRDRLRFVDWRRPGWGELACALAGQGLRIGLVEAAPLPVS